MGDANVKRADLDVLRALRVKPGGDGGYALSGEENAAVNAAIDEIKDARAAPAPSPSFSAGSPPAIVVAALAGLRDLAVALVQEVRREREAGPPRRARLVAYRCAALAIVAADGIDHNLAGRAEDIAHAMLAAERAAE